MQSVEQHNIMQNVLEKVEGVDFLRNLVFQKRCGI